MPSFSVEKWTPGEKPYLEEICEDRVVAEFPNGDKMYVSITERGIKVRAVARSISYPVAVRPEAANSVRVEFGGGDG